jgi:hypothetical protein
MQISNENEWTLNAPDGLLIVAGHVRHMVLKDDPALVV